MYPQCSQDAPRLSFPLRMALQTTLVALLANLRRSEFRLRHARLMSFLRLRFSIAQIEDWTLAQFLQWDWPLYLGLLDPHREQLI